MQSDFTHGIQEYLTRYYDGIKQEPHIKKRLASLIQYQLFTEKKALREWSHVEETRMLPSVDWKQLPYAIQQSRQPITHLTRILCAEEVSGLSARQRLQSYLPSIVYVTERQETLILRTGLQHAPNIYIIKCPKEGAELNTLYHEAFVGLFGINQLRCPNFTLVHGIFHAPRFIVDHGTVRWGVGQSIPHIIYENIQLSRSLYDLIPKTSDPQIIMELYLQVMFALRAGLRIGFTHYDLHIDNTLVQQVSSGVIFIPYRGLESSTIYLRSSAGAVVKIIDYGLSYFRKRLPEHHLEMDFGSVDPFYLYSYSVFRDRSFPVADAYKLLCGILHQALLVNTALFRRLRGLFRFWTKEDPKVALQKQVDNYFYAPLTTSTVEITLDSWITYCQRWMQENKMSSPIFEKLPPGATILSSGDAQEPFPLFTSLKPPPRCFPDLVDIVPLLSHKERLRYLPTYRTMLLSLSEEEKGATSFAEKLCSLAERYINVSYCQEFFSVDIGEELLHRIETRIGEIAREARIPFTPREIIRDVRMLLKLPILEGAPRRLPLDRFRPLLPVPDFTGECPPLNHAK